MELGNYLPKLDFQYISECVEVAIALNQEQIQADSELDKHKKEAEDDAIR